LGQYLKPSTEYLQVHDQEPHTLREIGEKIGVTREHIRQIEGKGLSKLRHPRHRRKMEPYL
jgi:RNA polymerase primary sigma factor